MALLRDIFVHGAWREASSSRRFQVVNPTTEEQIAEVVDADDRDVDSAVRAAHRASSAWRETPVEERARLVLALADELSRRSDEFAGLITIENGAPISESRHSPVAGAVFGEDPDAALAVAARLETGNIGINHYGSNAAAPFSGHKDSGVGTEFGVEGLASYLAYASIHLNS